MFNDMLDNTLNIGGKAVFMTAFGETVDRSAMFTGNPHISDLGYAFLFRNYRADHGKWQTSYLSGSNTWNFDFNADYNLWQNVTRELIPGWIAGFRGNPVNFTITYSTSVFYGLTVKQYE